MTWKNEKGFTWNPHAFKLYFHIKRTKLTCIVTVLRYWWYFLPEPPSCTHSPLSLPPFPSLPFLFFFSFFLPPSLPRLFIYLSYVSLFHWFLQQHSCISLHNHRFITLVGEAIKTWQVKIIRITKNRKPFAVPREYKQKLHPIILECVSHISRLHFSLCLLAIIQKIWGASWVCTLRLSGGHAHLCSVLYMRCRNGTESTAFKERLYEWIWETPAIILFL